jgi:hypothetical protein
MSSEEVNARRRGMSTKTQRWQPASGAIGRRAAVDCIQLCTRRRARSCLAGCPAHARVVCAGSTCGAFNSHASSPRSRGCSAEHVLQASAGQSRAKFATCVCRGNVSRKDPARGLDTKLRNAVPRAIPNRVALRPATNQPLPRPHSPGSRLALHIDPHSAAAAKPAPQALLGLAGPFEGGGNFARTPLSMGRAGISIDRGLLKKGPFPQNAVGFVRKSVLT